MLSGLTPRRGDALTAAVVAVVVIGSLTVLQELSQAADVWRAVMPWGMALMVAAIAALAWRSRFPLPAAVVAVAASTVYYPLAFPDGAIGLAGIVALFGLAADGHRWQAWSLGLAQFLIIHVWEAVAYGSPRLDSAVAVLEMVLVVLIAGEVVRRRRENRTLERDRADEAERGREEVLLRRASEERVRLAREVHDAVAHNISLINVQAGTALYLMESQPERAAEALATIKRTSKETLRELRATLNVLRSVDEQAPRAPSPGLDRIEDLAEGARGAGLDVQVVRRGGAMPPGAANAGAAAYRIVQEALTNAVRHSGAAAVTVEVDCGDGGVQVLVRDDGAAAADGFTSGNGITGIRERVAALGGDVAVGPCPGGGFAVRARLPATAHAAGPAADTGEAAAADGAAGGGRGDRARRERRG
ncbi:sensor histidine kinase [Streptomonospora wellingtoniae]|uniref:histidine kinase n=1 Tax=Streptomonospora wellingtoniae TaxID=3075544 RepID=A0ABU2KQB4_9ACTN|nr:sensor histidine kinase [Streptomonospora sp. DSM 45055]MDT0301467.1 sensor histidine kinase [Streptomonospora sp. DSM 45055]